MSNLMKLEEAVKWIEESNGKIFSVKFFKRTDGSIRTMTCRRGVSSHLVAGPKRPGLDFKKNELIPVFDMQKQKYRSIPIEGIIAIKIKGEWYEVQENILKYAQEYKSEDKDETLKTALQNSIIQFPGESE